MLKEFKDRQRAALVTVTQRHKKTFCGESTVKALQVFLSDGKSQHSVFLSRREKKGKKKMKKSDKWHHPDHPLRRDNTELKLLLPEKFLPSRSKGFWVSNYTLTRKKKSLLILKIINSMHSINTYYMPGKLRNMANKIQKPLISFHLHFNWRKETITKITR